MQNLLTISMAVVLAVAGTAWAQTTRPAGTGVGALLAETSELKGQDYFKARDRLVQSARTQAGRDELERIAKDPKTPVRDRLLAELCLVRSKDKPAASFYADFKKFVASVIADDRVWGSRAPWPIAVEKSIHRALGRGSKDPDVVKRLRSSETALFAEVLLWHTAEGLRDMVMPERPEPPADDRDFAGKDRLRRYEAAGRIAQICAGRFLRLKGDLDSVRILEGWATSEGGDRERAAGYLGSLVSNPRRAMPVRREAIFAQVRIGCKGLLKKLEVVRKETREEDIRAAAAEAIEQIRALEKSKKDAATKPAKKPGRR